MADQATPNLPARDLAATADFYARLGFEQTFCDEGWMILERGEVLLEFFPHPDIDPATSSFSCCLRLDDIDSLYRAALAAGIPETCSGQPRLHPARVEETGIRIACLIDPDGTLIRLVQNDRSDQ